MPRLEYCFPWHKTCNCRSCLLWKCLSWNKFSADYVRFHIFLSRKTFSMRKCWDGECFLLKTSLRRVCGCREHRLWWKLRLIQPVLFRIFLNFSCLRPVCFSAYGIFASWDIWHLLLCDGQNISSLVLTVQYAYGLCCSPDAVLSQCEIFGFLDPEVGFFNFAPTMSVAGCVVAVTCGDAFCKALGLGLVGKVWWQPRVLALEVNM